MNIKRIIDKNGKLIWYIVLIVVFVLFAIKSLNSYYEQQEKRKNLQIEENKNSSQNTEIQGIEEKEDFRIENDSIEKTMSSFVNFCNNRELEKAYAMLTEECKNEMFSNIENFEKNYIKNVFNEKKEYTMMKWAEDKNITTYQIKFLGDILATGGEGNISQEYYTFIKTNNTYKINVNNYICGKNLNKEIKNQGVTVKIKNINVYNTYEEYELSFTNNTSKEICLTGNKYVKNIYLKNSRGTTYSSLNSKFDSEEITIKPNNTKNYTVRFNKNYNPENQVNTIVLSDVIFDYEEYLKYENKSDYSNRTSIEIKF